MEKEYIGKNIIILNEELVEDTYSSYYTKKFKLKHNAIIRYIVLVGLLGVSLILGDVFIDAFHTLFGGIFFLVLSLNVGIIYYIYNKNLKGTISKVNHANRGKVVTVLYYEDKIHFNSKWNGETLEGNILYSDVTSIYITKNVILMLYNNDTKILNIVEETLEKTSTNQIIEKIKFYNPNIKIFY